MKHLMNFCIFIFLLLNNYKIHALNPRPFKIEASKQSNGQTTTAAPTTTAYAPTTTSSPIPRVTTIGTSTTILTTTTTAISTTTIRPKTAGNTTSSKAKPSTHVQSNYSARHLCNCDARVHLCDINCCCDADCTPDMLKSFVCDHRYQTSQNIQHQQGLPSCKINDGWLCIFKDNSRKETTETYNPNGVHNRVNSWPNYFRDEESKGSEREHYMFGDPILVYNEETEEIKSLDLPYSLLNSHCHVSEPMRHLVDFSRECMVSWGNSQDLFNTFISDINSFKLLRNRTIVTNGELAIDKAHRIDIGINICESDELSQKCTGMANETTILDKNCWKMNVLLHHNFTYLTGINISLTCKNENESGQGLWRMLNVKFIQPNETLSSQRRVSGKVGYNIGYPIITGKYVALNDAVEENEKQYLINYFHNNSTIREEHARILLPKSVSGICSDPTLDDAINFFENTLTQCSLPIDNSSSLNTDSNYTEICGKVQQRAFHYLLNNEHFPGKFELYVSEYGDPRNISSNWIPVETKNFESIQTTGSYVIGTNSFRCQNMLLSVRYEFTTARIAVNNLNHQNVVKRATVEFGKRVDLHFKLEEDLTLPIYVYVMFFDATSTSSRNYQKIEIGLNTLSIVLASIVLF